MDRAHDTGDRWARGPTQETDEERDSGSRERRRPPGRDDARGAQWREDTRVQPPNDDGRRTEQQRRGKGAQAQIQTNAGEVAPRATPPQRQSTTGGKGGLGGREGADSEIMWARGARAEPRCYVEHYAGCTAVAPRRLSTSVWRVDACPDGAAPECASVRACECVWRRRATRRGGSRAGGRADPRPSICRVVPAAPVLRWESVAGGRVY